jgi:hypothetical protein
MYGCRHTRELEFVLLSSECTRLYGKLNNCWFTRPTEEHADTEQQQQHRQDVATVFRGRHHVSQDDTRESIDDFEELDINSTTGSVEVVAEVHPAPEEVRLSPRVPFIVVIVMVLFFPRPL